MYSVYQHWDPLKVCIVGRSYSPEFYKFIENSRVRKVLERIATETEEDYQKLISLLESFGVEVLRPVVTDNYKDFLLPNGRVMPPPMTPRDYSIMLGNDFFFKVRNLTFNNLSEYWKKMRGESWAEAGPTSMEEYDQLDDFVKNELEGRFNNWYGKRLRHAEKKSKSLIPIEINNRLDDFFVDQAVWGDVIKHIAKNNTVYQGIVPPCFHQFNSAQNTRVGKDIYVGTDHYGQNLTDAIQSFQTHLPQYRWHPVDTGGHSDGTYCPVKPGLIVSLQDIPTYKDTFPGWEVVYLPGQSWRKVGEFLDLKRKNKGKWWVPGEELNDEFTDFVESWLSHWVGFVEETVFDVNMLVIDQQNVVCNNYNKKVFDAFDRHGITPHVVNFRHRYFWDGGLHCITSDVHREGTMQDYFPERG
jgi:N-dimethylarginine dimethylaminohydrolase